MSPNLTRPAAVMVNAGLMSGRSGVASLSLQSHSGKRGSARLWRTAQGSMRRDVQETPRRRASLGINKHFRAE